MRFRVLSLAAAALIMFSALPAAAHDWTGWKAGVSVGKIDGERHGSYYDDLSPSGTVVIASVEDRFMLGDFVAGVEVGGRYGRASDSKTWVSCTKADCGYDETLNRETGSDYGLSAGVSLGHPVGDVLVSARLGAEAANMTDSVTYDSKGAYPTFSQKVTGYRLGYYYGLRVEYPLSESWAVRADWTRSDLSERTEKWTGGSDTVSFVSDTVTLGISRSF